MINLRTPNKELLAELKADYRRADYWVKKSVGGEKKLDELCMQLLQEYYRTGKIQICPNTTRQPSRSIWDGWTSVRKRSRRSLKDGIEQWK